MVPGKYNITIYRGSTFNISIEAKHATSNAVNFTTEYDSMRMHIRQPWIKTATSSSGTPLFELTTANGRLSILGDTQIVMNISAADTEKLSFDSGQYDLELVKNGDPEVVDKILRGSVTVIGERTI